MILKDTSSIHSYNVKKIGVIFSILFIIIRVTTEILEPKGQVSTEFINALIALSFFVFVFTFNMLFS